jgi:Transposase IS116/IS110/IS902 family
VLLPTAQRPPPALAKQFLTDLNGSARAPAEVGDDPARFAAAHKLRAFAGTAPVTRASGRWHYVKARKVRNKRLVVHRDGGRHLRAPASSDSLRCDNG